MSCCKAEQRAAVNANIFVLPPVSASTLLLPNSSKVFAFAATGMSLAFAPLAPPPKSFLS